MSGGAAARMKGIRWERSVAKFYNTTTTRSTRPGVHDDAADIITDNNMLIECKDHSSWRVQEWFDQVERKCANERPVLVLKRRQRSTAEGLVVMRVGDLWLPEL